MVRTGYLQGDPDLFWWVDLVLFGPVAHEPRLRGQQGIEEQQAADKQKPEQEDMRSSQPMNKQIDFVFFFGMHQ